MMENDVIEIQQKPRVLVRPNSVFRVPADNEANLRSCEKENRKQIQVITKQDRETNTKGQIGAIVFLLRISGARISEILDIRGSDIIDNDMLLIRGKKKSRSRVVRVPELANQLKNIKRSQNVFLFSVSYWQVYRYLKKVGVVTYHQKPHHDIVTHQFRHDYISHAQKTTQSIETTAEIIGHKSTKSTQTYLAKEAKNG